MSAGKINLQASDGYVLGLSAPDGMVVDKNDTIATMTDVAAKADLNGDNTKTFKVADGIAVDDAVSKAQLDNNNTFAANDPRVMAALNASGTAPIYACRAWVNFNGTDTVAIRASGNVSSITDNGVGEYTVNFTTAMEDTDYNSIFGSRNYNDGLGGWLSEFGDPASQEGKTTNYLKIGNYNNSGTKTDNSTVNVSIFR